MRILAIEDDPVYVSLLQAYVSRAGKGIFELETVSMLAQGLTRLSEIYFDAVLLDLQLPDSRGPGTVVTVRSQFPNIPIVVLTSSDNDQTASEVFENGAQEYLVKGKINVNGVFRVLRTAAERKGIDDRLRWMESALAHCSDGVVVTENVSTGKWGPPIALANQAFLAATAYTSAEVIGKTFDIFAAEKTDEDTLAKIQNAFEKITPLATELILYRADGSPFWAELNMLPVPDKAGFLSHWLLIERDITEQKKAARAAEGQGESLQDQKRLAESVKELKAALSTAEQRLRLLHSGAQDQTNMVQTLFEANHELLGKIQTLLQAEDI